jgi:thymidine kinase
VAKLYFRYGTVGSAKTLNLLAVAHAYTQQDKRILLIKPAIDTRFGQDVVRSRAGLERAADLIVGADWRLDPVAFAGIACVLVDEAQFLSPAVVSQLRLAATELDIPVIAFGLRTDFRTRLFPGAARLMELADEITEVKTTCFTCNRKAVFNLKLVGGRPTRDGPQVELGAEEKYLPACPRCYTARFPGLWLAQE